MHRLDIWEERYGGPDYVFGTEPNVFLASKEAILPARGRALAVADGEGRNGVWLAERGLDVVSLDYSPAGQSKARALAAARGVTLTFELADVTAWEWPLEAFDLVAVIFTHFGSLERDRMFAGIRRALRPGGLLLLEGYSPKQRELKTGGPSRPEHFYTREMLETAFHEFRDVEIREYVTELSEGTRHAGLSAVIDFAGRK
jgi:SAM-dependent methyltransferase